MSDLVRLLMGVPRRGGHGARYPVRVEGGADLGLLREPLVDGARRLLELGYDGERLVTTRRVGKSFDDWKPVRIRVAAGLSVEDGDGGLKFKKFRPYGRPSATEAA